jgi:branched-chain amino acid transport system ATP-binding protein
VTSTLSVRNLTRSFGAVRAIDDVALEVGPGDIAGVIGPNGAGKTTLFNTISGFSAPDQGSVVFEGADITRMAPHRIAARGLVRTFQTTRPLHTSTVRENVVAGTHLRSSGGLLSSLVTTPRVRRSEREAAELADTLLATTGLDHAADAYPRELGGGQLRLLEIARALATRPTVVLLDEPAAGLNQTETRHLEKTLLAVRDQGVTLVIVEHDVELVFRLCDHVTVLDFGRVLRHGAPAEVRADPAVAEAYFGASHATGESEDS